MLRIQDNGDNFVPAEAQEHVELVAIARLDARFFHVGCVIRRLVIVVLQDL